MIARCCHAGIPGRHPNEVERNAAGKKNGASMVWNQALCVMCVVALRFFFVMEFRWTQVCCFRYSLDSTACAFFCVFVVDLCHTCVCVMTHWPVLVFSWIKGMLRT